MRAVLAILAVNGNACVFALGFAAALRGIALWSVPAAYLVAGVVLMAIGSWPFLRVRKS